MGFIFNRKEVAPNDGDLQISKKSKDDGVDVSKRKAVGTLAAALSHFGLGVVVGHNLPRSVGETNLDSRGRDQEASTWNGEAGGENPEREDLIRQYNEQRARANEILDFQKDWVTVKERVVKGEISAEDGFDELSEIGWDRFHRYLAEADKLYEQWEQFEEVVPETSPSPRDRPFEVPGPSESRA